MAKEWTVIAAKSADAQNSDPFYVGKEPVKVMIYPYGDLTASEYANIEEEDPDGTWGDFYDHAFNGSGGVVKLGTDTATSVVISAVGKYRVAIDDPTNAVGAAIKRATNKEF